MTIEKKFWKSGVTSQFYHCPVPFKVGSGCECCGTEVLRDYKLLSCDNKSLVFGNDKGSTELEKCLVNFVRNTSNKDKTIKEACACKNAGYLK